MTLILCVFKYKFTYDRYLILYYVELTKYLWHGKLSSQSLKVKIG